MPGAQERHWVRCIDDLDRMTGRPIIVQEFGYPSLGTVMTTEEQSTQSDQQHQLKKLVYGWDRMPVHTPEIQAEYAEQCLDRLLGDSRVAGVFWFQWFDQAECYNCGAKDCPCETAWGLVDQFDQPKPVYHRWQSTVERLGAE